MAPASRAGTTSASVSYVVRTRTWARDPPLREPLDRRRAVDAGHVQVHQDDVRIQVPGQAYRFRAVRRLADDREVRVALEHAAQSVANDRMVVDDEDSGRAHARRRLSAGWRSRARGPRWPSPRRAPTRSTGCLRRGSTRWRIAAQPEATTARRRRRRSEPNPTPSSGCRASPRRPCRTGSGRARVAPACLATLASASCAIRSSATSISGWSGTTSPVDETSTGTPYCAVHSSATRRERLEQASPSSCGGRDASTARRASARLSRARRAAASMWRCRSSGRSLAWPGRLELGDDPGQALRDGVVDLARHPLPLVQDAGLARLRQQLGVQTGVLLERDLESREGLAALLVLFGDLLADDRAAADDDGLDGDDHDIERPRLHLSAGTRRSAC